MIAGKHRRRLAQSMCIGLGLTITSGCREAEEFRAVAGNQVQSGLTSIVTGLIDGIFAVIEPDANETTAE